MLRVSTFTDLSTAGLRTGDKAKTAARRSSRPGAGTGDVRQRSSRGVRFTSDSPSASGTRISRAASDSDEHHRTDETPPAAAPVASQSTGSRRPSTAGTRSKRPSVLLMSTTTGDASWLQQCLTTSPPHEINQHGPEGLAPLHMATKHGHLACLEILVEWPSVDITLGTLPDGKTALHLAIDAKRNRVQCLKLLLRHGLSANQADANQTTPLHYAAILGRTGCLMALTEAKADVNAVDGNGLRALELSKMWGKRECSRRLQALQWAADKEAVDNEKQLNKYSNDVTRVLRTRQQKFEQAIRGQEAFDDWLSAKGLSASRSASLCHQHTTSSLLREQSQSSEEIQDSLTRSPSSVSLHPTSRLTSKFNSMWSVHSAPATLNHAAGRDAISALTSPSLPALLDPEDLPPPPAAAKPIRISFRAKHQHKDRSASNPLKSQHTEASPKSKAKRMKRPKAATPSRKPQKKRLPRVSTPHPGLSPKTNEIEEEELMAGAEESSDLPKLRIEELLLKERHQLPALKPLAWASSHQLHNSGVAPADVQPANASMPQVHVVARPLRANSLCLAALRSSTLDSVAEEEEMISTSSSLSDIDAYLGPTHSCLQLQCMSEGMESPCSASDLSHCSVEIFDQMSLSDD